MHKHLPHSQSFTTATVACSTGRTEKGGGGKGGRWSLTCNYWLSIFCDLCKCLSFGILEGGSEYWPRAVVYDFYCDPNGDILKPESVIEYPEYTYKGVTMPIIHCCCSVSSFITLQYDYPKIKVWLARCLCFRSLLVFKWLAHVWLLSWTLGVNSTVSQQTRIEISGHWKRFGVWFRPVFEGEKAFYFNGVLDECPVLLVFSSLAQSLCLSW